jgi:hypothetical protein
LLSKMSKAFSLKKSPQKLDLKRLKAVQDLGKLK